MSVEAPQKSLPVKDYGLDLVRDMLSVKENGMVRIFACNASLDVFNQPLFMSAARYVKERGAEISLLTGPILVVNEDGFSGLEQLAQENVLKLTQESFISNLDHFHVVEQDEEYKLFLEEVHHPFTVMPRGRFRLNPETFTEWEWQQQARISNNHFDGFVELTVENKRKLPQYYQALHATTGGLNRLVQFSGESSTALTFMTAKDLLDLPIAGEVFS